MLRRLFTLALVGCAGSAPATAPPGSPASSNTAPGQIPLLADVQLPAGGDDPDGEDDGLAGLEPGPRLAALASAAAARFQQVPAPAGAHPRVCDLTPHAGGLYVSTAVQPLGLDGARIYRYTDADGFAMAFDWDRGGAPRVTHEVGGQGITRLRVIDGRLHATDSDAPLYGGFGLTSAPFEDYIFVSDERGVFPPLGPDQSPPAGSKVLPFSFHTLDVIRYRGALVATGGCLALKDRSGTPYPGGLFVARPDQQVLSPRYFPGEGKNVGVVRTTYLHRYRGRLYIGFQNNRRRARWDIAVTAGDLLAERKPAVLLGRITPDGGWVTRRFASGAGRLYWIGSGYRGDGRGAVLYVSRDGQSFDRVALPADAGRPQDLLVVGEVRYLLTTAGLYRARGAGEQFTRIARAPAGDPFGAFDTFCSAPLTAYGDALWAGSTRDGALYRIVP